jgi:hypothetical protein
MHAQQRSEDPAPVSQETSPPASAPSAPAVPSSAATPTVEQQEAWKQNWLDQADRRGAIWHAQWKEALGAKRTAQPAGKRKKK